MPPSRLPLRCLGLISSPRFYVTNSKQPFKVDLETRKLLWGTNDHTFRSRMAESKRAAIKVMKKPDDFSNEERIIVPQETGTQIINAIPEEHKSGRLIRIYKQAKPATQSGSHGTRLWRIQFDCRERWENPLMGWSSTGDPLSNVSVEFATAEAAQHFCEKQGWPSYVDAPNKPILKVKSYGANFSWNKRTRVGSK